MKTPIIAFFLLFSVFLTEKGFSQQAPAAPAVPRAPRTVVCGKLLNVRESTVSIVISVNPFSQQPFAFSSPIQPDGGFSIGFELPVSVPATLVVGGKINQLVFVEPGDSLFVQSNLANNTFADVQFSGKGSGNNNLLLAFNQKYPFGATPYSDFQKVKDLDSPRYRAYTDSLHRLQREYADKLRLEYKPTPGAEVMLFGNVDYPWANALLDYPELNARYNQRNTYAIDGNFFSFLNEVPVNNDAAIFLRVYTDFIDKFIGSRFSLEVINATPDYDYEKMYADRYDFAKKYVQGEALSFALGKAILEGLVNGRVELIKPKLDDYVATNRRVEYTQIMQNVYQQLKHLEAGQPAPDFKMQSIDGKQMSFADFKGKVIYVDFWATWCGPCRQQLPHSKELKKVLEGKDIVFLYISTDTNIDAWKKMVTDQQLPGVHLLAGNTGIQSRYNVTGIPKYLLIGKDGKLVSAHARRPSDKRTLPFLQDLLRK